jgi:hypothetical protein
MADLVIESLTTVQGPPGQVKRGDTFYVRATTKNIGTLAAGESLTNHYLSITPTFGASAILITGRVTPTLAPGAVFVDEKVRFRVPNTVPGGLYLPVA